MCGICGYINYKNNYLKSINKEKNIAYTMREKLRNRGPDKGDTLICEHAVLSHRRLSVIDPQNGNQPMKRISEGYEFTIVYNGELYNTKELRCDLEKHGYYFSTSSDTEVLLYSYIHYGYSCVNRLNGIFAFAIYDSMRQCVFFARDRFGVKPLFYTILNNTFIFASEIKSLFAYPGVTPQLDNTGLCEIFAISPARTPGCGVFKDINEIKPGEYLVINRKGHYSRLYWALQSGEHKDNYKNTIEKTRYLLIDAIKRQLISDVPIATFLSGGLDSSFITAVAANEFKKERKQLSTYSFDYKDSNKYFHSSRFQPDSDTKWVPRMVETFNTAHKYLICPDEDLVPLLRDSVLAKDLPGMADCDASLLFYCREVKKNHTVCLSGECSDEIFGGYPWFRDPHAFKTNAFPWCYDLSMRCDILNPDLKLDLYNYSEMRYNESLKETPLYLCDNNEEKRRREISWLNIRWFMTNLLDRKDRMSMASGLEVRVPFCDHRLIEYVWNIPWYMKNKNNISKNILREVAKGILPEDVRARKKSPYPKTHNPFYEKAVKNQLKIIYDNPHSPILNICDKRKIKDIINGRFDYGKPFFGQLMAGPQFIGFLVQVNILLEEYNVKII